MFNRRALPLILLVATVMMAFGASFVAAANQSEQIQFQFSIPENQTLVYETVTLATMNLGEAMGMPMSQTIEERQVYSLEFGETQDDGTTPFTFRILEIVVDGVDLGEVLGGNDLGNFVEYSGYMNAKGGIEQIHFPQYAEIFEELGIDIDEMLQNIVVPFPEEPLTVGDTWQESQSIPFSFIPGVDGMDFTVNATYTLTDLDTAANTATIETVMQGHMDAEIRITPEDDPTLSEELTMTMVIDIQAEGASVIEISSGQLVSMNISMLQLAEIHLAIPGLPGAAETVTMPMTIEMEVRRIE